MNNIMKKLVNNGCVGIKTSFEDEGVKLNKAYMLRNISKEHGIKLAVKIGGPEAKTDFMNAIEIGADSIVGPMIESGYAAQKFVNMASNFDTNLGINIETIQAISNIDDILHVYDHVDYFVIGRVDLVGSMNLTRTSVDSDEMYNLIKPVLEKIKNKNKLVYIGGSITENSKNFMKNLYEQNLIDYFETRYAIFKFNETNFYDVVRLSHEFDYIWNKMNYDLLISESNNLKDRINLISTRCNKDYV